MTFGLYPEVKLMEARERRDAARTLLRASRDPANNAVSLAMPAFQVVARDWYKREAARWSARHAADVLQSLEREVFASIGDKPIDTIGTADVRNLLRKVEARGAIETAGRVRQRIEAVFAFAIASGFTDQNPGKTVQGAMARRPKASPQPAIVSLLEARKMLGEALQSPAQPVTREALLLLALTAVRPGELRHARWEQFDEDAPEPVWTIPADQMKGDLARKLGAPHVVPLAPKAVACIKRLRQLTGHCELVFPSVRNAATPMSENAIGYLLNRAGYHGRQTAHGFRATFSSIMNDHHPSDRGVIDMMLAHTPQGYSSSETAYNRAQHMQRRQELAAEWAKLIIEPA